MLRKENPESFQRLRAEGVLRLTRHGPITEASNVHVAGGLQVRQQHKDTRSNLELSLINTSGGLTGNDTLSWSVHAGEQSQCALSAPAAEKIYRSIDGVAKVDLKIEVGANASLSWLPQETILFDRSKFERNSIFQIVRSSKLLITDTLVLGRKASGETLQTFDCQDHWKVFSGNRLIHREDLFLNGSTPNLLNGPVGLGHNKSVTTLIYIGSDALDFENIVLKELTTIDPAVACGCSGIEIDGIPKLVCRLIAPDFYDVKPHLTKIIRQLNAQHLPKSWAL